MVVLLFLFCLVCGFDVPSPQFTVPVTALDTRFAINLIVNSTPVDGVLIDTGSADFIVYGIKKSNTECTSDPLGNQILYVDNTEVEFLNLFYCKANIELTPSTLNQVRSGFLWTNVVSVSQIDLPEQWPSSAQGVLGLGYTSQAYLRNSIFYNLMAMNSVNMVVGMQFSGTEGHEMHLGGVKEQYKPLIQWSERSIAEINHYFPIFQLSICGADIFHNISSNWPVLIDTGAACLTLPKNFYDSVMSWIPVNCSDSNFISINGWKVSKKLCKVQNRKLPWLSFRLSESSEALYIDLSQLIIDDKDGIPRLCVHAFGEISNDISILPSISFGSMVLKSLYTVLDYEHNRVGLANFVSIKQLDHTETNHQCAERKICIGAEYYYPPLNECKDPQCDAYYFQEVDPKTKMCRFRPSFAIISIFCMSCMILVELLLYGQYERISQTVLLRGTTGPMITTQVYIRSAIMRIRRWLRHMWGSTIVNTRNR